MIMILNIIIDIIIDIICVNLMVMYFLIESAVLCLGPPAKKMKIRGRPRVLRRWTPARMTAYLQCPVRRRESLHIYSVGGHGATESILKM